MQNIELAPQNPFSAPIEEPTSQLTPKNQWEAISEILAIAVLRNRFRQQQRAD
jgi:hypothetical protein